MLQEVLPLSAGVELAQTPALQAAVADSVCSLLQDFERSRAFTFLNEIKKRFQTTYGSRAQTALPYAMNSEFSSVLAAQLVRPCCSLPALLPQKASSGGLWGDVLV